MGAPCVIGLGEMSKMESSGIEPLFIRHSTIRKHVRYGLPSDPMRKRETANSLPPGPRVEKSYVTASWVLSVYVPVFGPYQMFATCVGWVTGASYGS